MTSQRKMERIICLMTLISVVAGQRPARINFPICPDSCTCIRQSINCSHRYLETFPGGSWSGAWDLNLEDNRLRTMEAEDLKNFVSLHLLNVRTNMLAEVDLSTLATLPYLATLVADDNAIQSVASPDTPPHLPRLMRVDLSNNYLSRVPASLLEAAPNLRELRLANNRMHKIFPMAHPSLRLLDLSGTKIREVPPDTFNRLRSLEELYLANNSLTTLGDNMRKMKHLKVLDISGNHFKRLSGSDLPPFQKLHTLSVLYNPMMDISPGSVEMALSTIGAVVDARGTQAACRCHLRNLRRWAKTRYVEVYASCPQVSDPHFCDRSKVTPATLIEEEDFFFKTLLPRKERALPKTRLTSGPDVLNHTDQPTLVLRAGSKEPAIVEKC